MHETRVEADERLERHLSAQDKRLDEISKTIAKWGGGLTVIMAVGGLAIAAVEALRK